MPPLPAKREGRAALLLHQGADRYPAGVNALEVHGWHTECGACGHGRGGWASSPALKGLPILEPSSRDCPACSVAFTHVYDTTNNKVTVLPARSAEDAA